MHQPNATTGLEGLARPCELDSTCASPPTGAVDGSKALLVLFGPVSLVSTLQKLLKDFGDRHGLPAPRFKGASTRYMSLDLVQLELVPSSADFAWETARQLALNLSPAKPLPLYPQRIGMFLAHRAQFWLAFDKQEPLLVSCLDTPAALQLLNSFVDAAARAGAHLHELEPHWLSAMAFRFLPKSYT